MRQKHRRRPRGLRRRHDGQKCRYAPSASTDPVSEYAVGMTYESQASNDEELVLRDVRALLDQLQLDPEHSLVMESRLIRSRTSAISAIETFASQRSAAPCGLECANRPRHALPANESGHDVRRA